VFAALTILDMMSLPEIFALAVIYGIVGAFFTPALSALYPSLTPPEHYDAANSLRQILLQVALIGGPALGGYLIAQWSVSAALAFDALTFLVSFFALALTRPQTLQATKQVHDAQRVGGFRRQWSEIFGGLSFLRGEPGVFTLILFFSLTNGLNDVEAVLVPRLARLELGLSAAEFGLLATAMGGGTLFGALFAGLFAQRVRRRAQLICLSIMVFGGAIVLMGLAENARTLYLAFALFGVTFILPEVVFSSFLQRIVPAEMRGRVFGSISLLAMVMNPLGLLLAGVLGDSIGPRAGLWIGGGCIAVLSLLTLALPVVRSLNHRDTTPPLVVASGANGMIVSPESDRP